MGRDCDGPEDLLQQTFACAIERAASFDARRTLVPWLTGILARQAALLRRRSARVVEPDRLTERAAPADPSERTEQRELAGTVRTALASVPELYRGVLLPLLEDGKRPEEIARELGHAPSILSRSAPTPVNSAPPAKMAISSRLRVTASNDRLAPSSTAREGTR